MDKAVIELSVPESVPAQTHVKICSWIFEVARPAFGKDGFVDIWLAKCYEDEAGNFVEPEVPGLNIKVEGEDYDALIAIPTTVQDLITDSTQILSQFLIDHGYIDGVVIIREGD